MSERLEILSSIPGIGKTTALLILLDMPEIGALDCKQVASLAGLAPMSQSSGKWQGKARIQGGRPNLRHAIFMPALVAIRFNPDLKAKYDQLVANGKEKKVAITAVMRKLLVLANALLRDHLRIPGSSGHRFRKYPATHSDFIRPLIPEHPATL